VGARVGVGVSAALQPAQPVPTSPTWSVFLAGANFDVNTEYRVKVKNSAAQEKPRQAAELFFYAIVRWRKGSQPNGHRIVYSALLSLSRTRRQRPNKSPGLGKSFVTILAKFVARVGRLCTERKVLV